MGEDDREHEQPCSRCGREVAECAVCGRTDCPNEICYPCLRIETGMSMPHPHPHGG